MAMISIKNLVAPVSNTVHLATIGFAVLGFAVWRWSGGEINFVRGNRPSTQAAYERAGASSILDRTPPEAKLVERRREAPTEERHEVEISDAAADDLLGSILNKKAAEPSVDRRNDTSKKRSASSLEDIERSLGINKK